MFMNINWDMVRRIAVGAFCLAAAAGSIHGYLQGTAGDEVSVLYAVQTPASYEEERFRSPEEIPPAEDADRCIDLNSASEEELCTLKGIGPAKAKAICEYRENYGGFVCIEEIMEVKGIGAGTFQKIKEDIRVVD